MLTFQQIIQTLTQFWEKQGCIIHQGHDVEVGAGTFNPATFLRCLGPEPYNTAYVEPSRRPTDGRYGLNPNRLQLFHQFQVIMKPSPDNIQELYLESLRALGLDLDSHDIRFVHDDWESPTLGAWGLGWEVWIDGMEITQFTYFQAIGSVLLDPISAEIAYGIERLAMYIQNVENIFDVRWNDTLTLGDIAKQNEWEWSTYNFEQSSTQMWSRHFSDYEQEATRLIEKKLPIPAYDFVLKASHAFNMLDARGAISVTERTGYIARIRDLARLVATGYLASREEKGFPLLPKERSKDNPTTIHYPPSTFSAEKTDDFILEIGSEQLPATFIPIGMKNLENACKKLFQEAGLSYKAITCYGTPQRIAIYVQDLVEGTKTSEVEKKGPPLSSAFDSDGNPTAQGIGFFRSLGYEKFPSKASLEKEGFSIRSIKEIEYLFYTKKTPAESTKTLLQQHLPSLITNLEFPKKMRWGSYSISYARPIHWIVALYGKEVIPFALESLTSGQKTKGHAQLSPSYVEIHHPKEYLETLRAHFVLADPKERKQIILEQLEKAETSASGKALCVDKVLSQVLYLTEWPCLIQANFDPKFLSIPQEVLISEMVEHQKYFPLEDASSKKLQNKFLITADNTPCPLILKGNEKVLSARLSDGVFLYEQDVKTPLESFAEKLKTMTFQQSLGSMWDKVERLQKHVKVLHQFLPIADLSVVQRAAFLCKADLSSTLVAEFPELQGTIGKYYALAQNEPKEVAIAIEEHWMPLSESGMLPQTACAILVSLADKIDNLLGYFSVGLKPTSSSDPYALRRQTFGLLKMLIEGKYSINLEEVLMLCMNHFPKKAEVIEDILSFITHRAKSLFEECGYRKDEMDASLQGKCIDPYLQLCKVQALHSFRLTPSFAGLYEVYKRAKGFLDAKAKTTIEEAFFSHPREKALFTILQSTKKEIQNHLKTFDFFSTFTALSALQPPLSALLEEVKILDPDPTIRTYRTALINEVFSLFEGLIDFSKIQEL